MCRRVKLALQMCRCSAMHLAHGCVADQCAVRERCEHVHAAIDAERLAALDAPEERLHRKIEPMQHRAFALAIERCKAAVETVNRLAKRRGLCVLLLTGDVMPRRG